MPGRYDPHRKILPFNTKTPVGVVEHLPMKIKARESNLPPGREGFLTWLYNQFPEAYSVLEARAPQVLTTGPIGFGATDDALPSATSGAATASPGWVQTIQNIALPALQIYQQKKIVDLQLKRAQAGQRPLDIAEYMGDSSIKTGLDSSTQRMFLIIGGLLVGGFVLHSFLRGRHG